ncbi:hypothetical protein QF023_001592 [Chryseobacterium sp. SLBN-27]|uniref:hypothetical protein n=1 Tax=Chryseobacterium sp. SLBN-27 TaxID=3042287 RepID=UPI00285E31D6|nr:hypothetical protein [Chryseobacterium sp. SLBN-27]MDR6158076.1 hypothetical protein [Chryseobacterium sp. SLBN-27]
MSLVYTDFRLAGYRNLHTCKELLSILDSCDARKKKQILHNIYYLSGYIIEFCYKFALFSGLKASKFQDLGTFKDESFRKKWRDHSFERLKNICTEYKIVFSADIPYLGNNSIDKNLKELIRNWDVQMRYSIKLTKNTVLTEEDVINFVVLCEKILTKTDSNFS